MKYLFSGCISLMSLPDISKWDTRKVTNMSYMFKNCSSLIKLPDISKWDKMLPKWTVCLKIVVHY